MKQFLIFLTVGGAAIYALLVITHNVLPEPAGQTQPNHPVTQRLSAWGPQLASRSLGQKAHAPSSTPQQPVPLPPQQYAAYGPIHQRHVLVKIRSEHPTTNI